MHYKGLTNMHYFHNNTSAVPDITNDSYLSHNRNQNKVTLTTESWPLRSGAVFC